LIPGGRIGAAIVGDAVHAAGRFRVRLTSAIYQVP
jgi:hypothetical protein